MTLQEAIETIEDRLGQRTEIDAAIKRELGLSQTFFESKGSLPWFLARRVSSSVGGQSLSLPSDFLMEAPWEPLLRIIRDDGQVKDLVKSEMYEVVSARESQGEPSFYVLEVDSALLVPKPDMVYGVEIIYLGRDTRADTLPLNGTNRWLTHAPLVLVNHAGFKVASHLRSQETAQLFAIGLQEAEQAMWSKHYAMPMVARGMALGG